MTTPMRYRRCGRSGLLLPAISLGLWHNFGAGSDPDTMRAICRTAFDAGVTHFDLANNYGPPPGAAETSFGDILRRDFVDRRDELVIASKAGYLMWPGPYGEWGSRKSLIASCDQSLKRLGLDYVDIFYSHRFDPDTPLEETMAALDHIVRSGRALYVGISSYRAAETKRAAAMLRQLATPCLIHQPSYSMINRWSERDRLHDTLAEEGIGSIAFSPLAQGLLTSRYLHGIPAGSRATRGSSLDPAVLTKANIGKLGELEAIAGKRAQSLAQMALAWVLKDPRVTSALIGASRPEQVIECVAALERPEFDATELGQIDRITGPGDYFEAGVRS